LWRAVQRRWVPALCIAAAAVIAAVVTAIVLPSRYLSTGTILIEQQELPTDFVRSTVSSYATQRIQVISQRVMTTDNLLNIIERNELYPNMRKGAREEMIDAMRRDTKLQMISADVIDPRGGGAVKAAIAFSISYTSPSAQRAASVANELVSLYLQRNIETRQRNSREAVEFLEGESARVGADIKEIESRLTDLKTQHGNELPELQQLNMSTLDRVADDIRETNSRIQTLDQQIVYLDGQLALINPSAQVYTSTGERVQTPADRLKYLRSSFAQASALYSADHPDVQRLKREIAGLEAALGAIASAGGSDSDKSQQLKDAQSQLANARQRYAADHPDVLRLERLVESLQKDHADSAALPGAGSATASGDIDNPVYVQLMAQRESAAGQRKSLEDQQGQLQSKLYAYEHRLAQAPMVEREYAGLVRELDSAQQQYRQMRQKQMDAQISVNLEVERKGERFTLIDPPLVPGRPVSPNRQLIVVAGILLALGAALGTTVLLELLDGSVRGRQDLLQLLSVPPLAVIPLMFTNADLVARRRRIRYVLFGAFASLALSPVLVHFFYRPLDVLWAAGLRRLGG
jgi:uncharacterized protein involved in exopolysaccharide biosynthesis